MIDNPENIDSPSGQDGQKNLGLDEPKKEQGSDTEGLLGVLSPCWPFKNWTPELNHFD